MFQPLEPWSDYSDGIPYDHSTIMSDAPDWYLYVLVMF